MKYIYIELNPNFRIIYIYAVINLTIKIIINQSLTESLDHSRYIPNDYDFNNLSSYYNTDYQEPHIVKFNNKDYIEIEWLPEYVTLSVTIRKDRDYHYGITHGRNYHHEKLDADVIWML